MTTFKFKKTILASTLLLLSAFQASAAINHSVYISATGNNQNDGLTPATAWKSMNFLNGKEFGPGAKILFKRGESFPGALTLLGSGSAEEPIVVGAYGTGNKPILTGKWNSKEIFLLDSGNEYIEFFGLKLTNYNTTFQDVKERYGIRIKIPARAGELKHLHFDKLDFFNIQGSGKEWHEEDHRSAGIYATTADNDVYGARFNDVVIENSTFTDIDGLGVLLKDMSQDITDVRKDATPYFPTVGFVFQNNSGLNIYRNLLMLRGTKDALIQHNTMDTTVEGSAFWSFATEGTLVQYNLFKHLRAADADAYALHFDYNNKDTLMQYNIGYDIEGGLIEYIVDSTYPNSFQENGIARYNIGIDVGFRDKPNGAGIFLTGRVTGGQFYNNTLIQLNKPMTNAISFNDWGGEWPDNNQIFNNIFYVAGDETVKHNQPIRFNKLGNVVSNNLYAGNIAPPQTWDNIITDINPISGDPMFVNPAGLTAEDFMITPGSAAIGKGLVIADNGGVDYFGNAVSATEAPALGAHDFTVNYLAPTDDAGVKDHEHAHKVDDKKEHKKRKDHHKEKDVRKTHKNYGAKPTIDLRAAKIKFKKPKKNQAEGQEPEIKSIGHTHQGLMKFTVNANRDIKSAILSLYAHEAGHTITIHKVADNTWLETDVSAKNAPELGEIIASEASLVEGMYVDFDLSSYITAAGEYSIGITTDSVKSVDINTKEAEENAPLLELSY